MPRLLLCPPDHYHIAYEINPWMHRGRDADPGVAAAQWADLRRALTLLGCELDLVAPQPGLPDMVFTANAALVVDRQAILARFRYPQRQNESAHFRAWFEQHGYTVTVPPAPLYFEGEGDALFVGDTLFCGYRFRSDIRVHRWLGDQLHSLAVSVELVDERFYHLDTCFCPLADGLAAWYPPAFDEYAQRAIADHVAELIAVPADEALRFACNTVVLGRDVVLPAGCPVFETALSTRGYRCHPVEMTEFLKAGGACKCLVLFLPQRVRAAESLTPQGQETAAEA